MSVIVKICGLATEASLDAALGHGADMAGFVFFDKSPRHVSLELAANLGRRAANRACKVLVTVDAGDALLAAAIKALDPGLLQLHGNETVKQCTELKEKGLGVIKVFSIANDFDFQETNLYEKVADYFLFDTKSESYGGTGKTFDWRLLNNYNKHIPFFLSGGLSAANIDEAIQLKDMSLYALDVNSGVEISPGLKDIDKIRDIKNILTSNS